MIHLPGSASVSESTQQHSRNDKDLHNTCVVRHGCDSEAIKFSRASTSSEMGVPWKNRRVLRSERYIRACNAFKVGGTIWVWWVRRLNLHLYYLLMFSVNSVSRWQPAHITPTPEIVQTTRVVVLKNNRITNYLQLVKAYSHILFFTAGYNVSSLLFSNCAHEMGPH